MNGGDEERYLLLLEDRARIDPRPIADELGRMRGLPAIEARRLVRRGGGIPAEDLGAEEASRLHRILTEHGVPSRIVLAAALPEFPPIESFVQADSQHDGILLSGGDGRIAYLVWEQVFLANAALIFEGGYLEGTGLEMGLVPGIPDLAPEEAMLVRENAILRKELKAEEAGGEPVLDRMERGRLPRYAGVLDLVGSELSCWVRILGKHMVMRSGRVQLGGARGYAHLIRETAKECPPEALGPLALMLIRGDDIKNVALAGLGELTQHTRWRLLLKLTDSDA